MKMFAAHCWKIQRLGGTANEPNFLFIKCSQWLRSCVEITSMAYCKSSFFYYQVNQFQVRRIAAELSALKFGPSVRPSV